MTSILTNISAMSALQTLRHVSASLGETQGRVSSGLRVATASDNAAYWSISTTMRSDNMAMSAVADALGLGAAKVDTAYAGMESVVDVLKQFKARLVAATEEGVDKAKIQTELDQLNQQIDAIASASSFNGVNWLSTDVADLGGAVASVTSSFVRAEDGDVSVKKTNVALASVTLFNTSGGGLLQKGKPTDYGGMIPSPPQGSTSGSQFFTMPSSGTAWPAGGEITFDLLLDGVNPDAGTPYPVTIDQATVIAALGTDTITDGADMVKVLEQAFGSLVPVSVSGWGTSPSYPFGYFRITSDDTVNGLYSSVKVANLVSTLSGAEDFGLASPSSSNNRYATAYLSFTEGFVLDDNHEFTFDVTVNNGSVQRYTVTEADIDAVLGDSNGVVSSAEEYAAVLAHVMAPSGLQISTGSYYDDTKYISFRPDPLVYPQQGSNSRIVFSNVDGNEALFDLADVDITDPAIDIDTYLMGVEKMLKKTISAASRLGALQGRIDMQTEFVSRLSANIDKGVGRLVDADMNEESTRLKALQTQEQLAIQSLSIANTGADVIMQLFR